MDDPGIIVVSIKAGLLLAAIFVLFVMTVLSIGAFNTLDNCVDLGYMMIGGQKYQCTLVE